MVFYAQYELYKNTKKIKNSQKKVRLMEFLKKNKTEVVNKESVDDKLDDQITELRNDIYKIKETLNSLITQLYDKGLIE